MLDNRSNISTAQSGAGRPTEAAAYADLLIIDNIMPCGFSPFRTIEYGHYLSFFDAALLSLQGWHLWIGNETFEEELAALPIDPGLKDRVMPFAAGARIAARLAYITFAGNAFRLLHYLESRNLPFILQLYPGGSFGIDQPECDENLRRVLHSRFCRKVIVTQTLTRDYILEKLTCDPEKVELIYGGVFEGRTDFDFLHDKRFYPRDKQTLDICFVAHKYADNLTAKGFDNFIAVANDLARSDARLRFHVVGDYGPQDLPLGEAEGRFTFHGRQDNSFFREFYAGMDAIVSINRAFDLAPGVFDGFPTGACIEAGLHGVLNCINDPLALNPVFTDGRDILLLDFDLRRSAERIRALLEDTKGLYELAYSNWRKFQEVFDTDRQLWARTRLIAAELRRDQVLVAPPAADPSLLDARPLNAAVAPYQRQLREREAALLAAAAEAATRARDAGELERQFRAVLDSTSWRVTRPLRVAFANAPSARRWLRRGIKFLWWSGTGQIHHRYREWRQFQRRSRPDQGA